MRRTGIAWCVLALAVALSGCGGGGGHASSTTTTTRAVPRTTTSTTIPVVKYTVKQGDTLTAIAAHFGVPSSSIAAASHLANPDQLTLGQVLVIPPKPPVALVVTPAEGAPGTGFALKLTGAASSENVTFEVDSPTGKFTGSPHQPGTDGAVTATYQSSPTDPPGVRHVIAHGDQGTTATAQFTLSNPAASTTTP